MTGVEFELIRGWETDDVSGGFELDVPVVGGVLGDVGFVVGPDGPLTGTVVFVTDDTVDVAWPVALLTV